MMQWKKPIRSSDSFTLAGMLVTFSCVTVGYVLLMLVVSALQRLQEPVYYGENRIVMCQLRLLFTQSNRPSSQENTLFFIYQKERQTLEYDRGRLVCRSGYEVFLQGVDALQFQRRKECYYVTWVRKGKREEALLTCE